MKSDGSIDTAATKTFLQGKAQADWSASVGTGVDECAANTASKSIIICEETYNT
jgi:hypothetical protein